MRASRSRHPRTHSPTPLPHAILSPPMLPLVYFAFPIFVLLLYMERARFQALKAAAGFGAMRGYFGPDTRASLLMGVGNVVIGAAIGGVMLLRKRRGG